MILNVSGRTDVVAFYTEWFMNRYHEGFVDVRNPFYPKQVSRINFDDVDMILFCTKNPLPIIKYLKEIKKPIVFHVTLTPYKNDIEPNVPPKGRLIEAVKEICGIIGSDNVYIRYDPLFKSPKYSIEYHIKAFDNLCKSLAGYVKHIIISFIDDYKNVRKNKNILQIQELTEEDYNQIGSNFSKSAAKYNMTVQTCSEEKNLIENGFVKQDCLTKEMVYKLTNKILSKKWFSRNNKHCNCVEMVDIGSYNSCLHLCKYCYANYNQNQVKNNMKNHNKTSTLLIGELEKDDLIKLRK